MIGIGGAAMDDADKVKAGRREYMRQWRERNREHVRAYHRQYYREHREQIRETQDRYFKKYLEANK
jgi:predicted solute-binding protein